MSSRGWDRYEIGMKVKCVRPDDYFQHVAKNLRNRVGTITAIQAFSGKPIINYAAVGRRKAFQWVATHQDAIEIVENDLPLDAGRGVA